MNKHLNRWSRAVHRWGAILLVIPLSLVIGTGLLLQIKKQWTWVQPQTTRGYFDETVNLKHLLQAAKTDSNAKLTSWQDIDRIDIRPSKGIAKVRGKNRWEVQVDLKRQTVVQSQYRRSDLIESLHDGSFFGDWAKLSIFLANGIVLFVLWLTGFYLWILPYLSRARKAKRHARQLSHSQDKSLGTSRKTYSFDQSS